MDLFSLPDNPIPHGAVAGKVTTSDGAVLRTAYWSAVKAQVLGTVCLFQGRSECIEKYFEVVRDLRARGFAVAALDWRGQGGSERRLRNRRKGHVDAFDEYDRDLEAFLQQVVLPNCPPPYFALGHSTGGLVCLRGARQGWTRFSRMVLVSPLLALAPARPSQSTTRRVAAFLTAIGLGELCVPASRSPPIATLSFDDNALTSDPVRFARAVEIATKLPQVAVGPPTFGWLYAACRAMEEAAEPEFGPSIRVPTMLVAASLDKIVSPRAIEALSGELRAGAQVSIAGARHEILMERDSLRSQFFAAFDAFVPGS